VLSCCDAGEREGSDVQSSRSLPVNGIVFSTDFDSKSGMLSN